MAANSENAAPAQPTTVTRGQVDELDLHSPSSNVELNGSMRGSAIHSDAAQASSDSANMSLFFAFNRPVLELHPVGGAAFEADAAMANFDTGDLHTNTAAFTEAATTAASNLETAQSDLTPAARAQYSGLGSESPDNTSPTIGQQSEGTIFAPQTLAGLVEPQAPDAPTPPPASGPAALKAAAPEPTPPQDASDPQDPADDGTVQNNFGISAISDTNAAADMAGENFAVGTPVGIMAHATDGDQVDSVTYMLSDDAGGLFAINPSTGQVFVAGVLDRETAASHTIEVTAVSTDGSTATRAFTINIADTDEFDISPITDANTAGNAIAEGAANGSEIGITASAGDADATNNTVTYQMVDASGNPLVGGPFDIDATTGVMTVRDNTLLDFETSDLVTTYVKATSSDGSTTMRSFDVSVLDTGEFSVSAISDSDGASNSVTENAAVGTSVGVTAFASDADGTDSVSYALSDDAGGLFAIDATTGEVTVAGPIDRETAASYAIEVTATSTDGSTQTQTYAIAVNDADEFDVSAITDTDASANTLAEDAGAGTAIGITAAATDADATNSAVSYGVDDNRFTVDPDGTVRVAAGAAFDFETEPTVMFNVIATSADGSFSTQQVAIDIQRDNSAPTDMKFAINQDLATNESGNFAAGSTVAIVSGVVDADVGETFTYTLADNGNGMFAIDADTGAITLNSDQAPIDGTIDITVRVTDSQGGSYDESLTIVAGDNGYTHAVGGAENNLIVTAGGDDLIQSGAGDDLIYAGSGNDTVSGGTGDDYAFLGDGDDVYDTTSGNADANDGADYIDGGAGNDTIWAGGQNDTLVGGTGNDHLYGEAGDDTFIYAAGDGSDTVVGGAGWTDTVELVGMDGPVTIDGLTVTGDGWTLVLDPGHAIIGQTGESLDLSADSSGTITFDDGAEMAISQIEHISW